MSKLKNVRSNNTICHIQDTGSRLTFKTSVNTYPSVGAVKDNLKIMQLLRLSSLRNVSDNMVETTISITPMTYIEFKNFCSETREQTS
jgi:hypothetical protein